MDMKHLIAGFDRGIDSGLLWLGDNAAFFFDAMRFWLEQLYYGVLWPLTLLPYYLTALLIGLIGWRVVSLSFGIATVLGLLACAFMNLWADTVTTLALVIAAMVLTLAISLPIGILAGLSPRLERVLAPVLDLIQTIPPYIYLLPAIALLGFGPATALLATVIVAMPPAIRLASLGIRITPQEFIELGQAIGASRIQTFFKIRLPFALRSIMAGINQSLMMAFGMVVIAGIVGSGGLGETIYRAIRKLDIAISIDAAIAIVILTMVLDRLTQGAMQQEEEQGR